MIFLYTFEFFIIEIFPKTDERAHGRICKRTIAIKTPIMGENCFAKLATLTTNWTKISQLMHLSKFIQSNFVRKANGNILNHKYE